MSCNSNKNTTHQNTTEQTLTEEKCRDYEEKAAVVSILLYGCTTWTLTKTAGEET